jgi:PAS domain S-box-containing protein
VDVSANRRKLRISARRARVVLILARVEESAEELYEDAPCGYMSSLMDGTIVRVNRTFLRWTGLARDEVVGRKVATLFSPASRLYFEVHASPLLRLEGEVHGLALELGGAHGRTLPVLIDAKLKRDERGEPRFVRTTFCAAASRLRASAWRSLPRSGAGSTRSAPCPSVRSAWWSCSSPRPPAAPGSTSATSAPRSPR